MVLLLNALEMYSKSIPPARGPSPDKHDLLVRLVERLINPRTGPKFSHADPVYFRNRTRYFAAAREKVRKTL